jgi:two-component system, sensor histidine kinase and response regulator
LTAAAAEGRFEDEGWRIRKDGSRFWANVVITPIWDEGGRLKGFTKITRDLTERKQVEESLRQSEARFRAVSQSANDGIVSADSNGSIIYWNWDAQSIFGYSEHEVLGRPLTLLMPESYQDAHRSGLARFLATGVPHVIGNTVELEGRRKDGSQFPMELSLATWENDEGRCFTGMIREITRRRQSEEAQVRAIAAADMANRAKSAFLANMSHEIRTPMNAIIGMTELLLDTALTATQREYLTMVQDSGEALLSVINDILDFSKIEAGRFTLDLELFDLPESLGDTMKSLALRAHRKGLELICHVHPDVPDFVLGDRHRLRQVLVNLVGNAIKFTEEGEIVLDAHCESRNKDEILLHLSVKDTGIGIPQDNQQRIFEAFEQADESTSRRYGGTGLGLAISGRLVELMGGRIWVDSKLGQGSAFHFTARFALAEGELPKQSPAARNRLHGLRVLVVDDNATNCLILAEMLHNWQMQPQTLTRSADVLDLMRARQRAGDGFDLVIIDANMPGLNGFDLAAAIRNDPDVGSAITMMLASSGGRGRQRPRVAARCPHS